MRYSDNPTRVVVTTLSTLGIAYLGIWFRLLIPTGVGPSPDALFAVPSGRDTDLSWFTSTPAGIATSIGLAFGMTVSIIFAVIDLSGSLRIGAPLLILIFGALAVLVILEVPTRNARADLTEWAQERYGVSIPESAVESSGDTLSGTFRLKDGRIVSLEHYADTDGDTVYYLGDASSEAAKEIPARPGL